METKSKYWCILLYDRDCPLIFDSFKKSVSKKELKNAIDTWISRHNFEGKLLDLVSINYNCFHSIPLLLQLQKIPQVRWDYFMSGGVKFGQIPNYLIYE